jgi:hypothetical protein
LTPVQVPIPAAAADAAYSATSMCARLVDGRVLCSGSVRPGIETATLVEITDFAGANQIATQYQSGCLLRSGVVSCFGVHLVLGTGDTSVWQPLPVTLACPE